MAFIVKGGNNLGCNFNSKQPTAKAMLSLLPSSSKHVMSPMAYATWFYN